jgi:GNAT superfamily N-acetyltransferase
MPDDATTPRAILAAQRFWTLGSDSHDLGAATLMAHSGAPSHPLGTFLQNLRPRDPDKLDAVLEAAAKILRCPCPRIVLDTAAPHWVCALLVERDWRIEHQLQLVLPAELRLPAARDGHVRPLTDIDDDWAALRRLFRQDHIEEDEKAGRPVRPESATDDAITLRRGLVQEKAQYFVAEENGRLTGFVCSWPGDDGMGVIEDVFVHPDGRSRGLATSLITSAVRHARRDGPRPLVIGSDPDDTPKHLYARLGFVPTAVTTSLIPATRAGADIRLRLKR